MFQSWCAEADVSVCAVLVRGSVDGFNRSMIVLFWKHAWEDAEVQQVETEILVLFIAPCWRKGFFFAENLFENPNKANTTQVKPVYLELRSKFLRSQELLRSPGASFQTHLPPPAEGVPAQAILFLFGGFPSILQHSLSPDMKSWLQPHLLGQPEE